MANEKRLIDANEFRNRLSHVVYDIFEVHEKDGQLTGTASVGYYTDTIEEVLKKTKTVDAVEVVRCKDCKDCEMCYPEKRLDREATQAWLCKRYKRHVKPDDFCSYGERREGE